MSISAEVEKYHRRKYGLGYRHIQYLLMILTIVIFYGQRTTLSMAIIAMTDGNPPDPSIPTYPDWKNVYLIVSSFFWGYIIPLVTAGLLGERFGPKWFLVGTMILGSIFMALIPLAAQLFGSTGVIVCRVFQGFNQAFLFPSTHILISRWAPIYERSRTSSLVYGSCGLSVVISMLATGAVCGSSLGWPHVFYLYGGGGVLWAIIFAIFGENSPSQHKRISKKERNYIRGGNLVVETRKGPTPWMSIISSLPIWAILFSVCPQVWGMYTLLTEIPSFVYKFMDFDIRSSTQLSSFPYVVYFLMGLTTAPLGDKLIAYKIISIATTRKILNSLGLLIPGMAFLVLGFVTTDQKEIAVFLLVVSVGFSSFINTGSSANMIDIAPNYAGTIMGLVNGCSQVFAIMVPLAVEFWGNDKMDISLWRKMFWLAAFISFFFGSFYILFGSGDVQKWDNQEVGSNAEDNDEEATTSL